MGSGLPQQIQRAFYNIDFDFGVGRFGGHGGHKKLLSVPKMAMATTSNPVALGIEAGDGGAENLAE